MALNIKNPEAGRLARQLSAMTGETLTEAVVNALRERLERQNQRRPRPLTVAEILREARERLSRLPVRDPRSADAVVGYDDAGLRADGGGHSALLAILTGEAGASVYENALERDPKRLISAASVLEVALVLESRYGPEGPRELDAILQRAPIEAVPVDLDQLDWARHASHRYGRGRHLAALNFGDCFSYALAKTTGEPLLFDGADFARTDIRSAVTL